MNRICSIEGCGSAVLARGWCGKHYDRWRRLGDAEAPVRSASECAEDGCRRPCVGQGWCQTHYSRYVKAPKQREARAAAKLNRICVQCGGPIPVSRRARAVFCSRECKNAEFVASGRQRESVLRSYFKNRYGLTLEEAEEMRRGGCDICQRTDSVGRHGQLHIDHDHETGRVRGVLCQQCNTGLGAFRDNPVLLRAAADYLTR